MKKEPLKLIDCTRENCGMRLDVLQSGKSVSYMFSRSSNWQKVDNAFLAKFQIANQIVFGELINQSISCIEIKEFVLLISNSKLSLNPD